MHGGRLLIVVGLVLVAGGVLWLLGERIGLGRLPGDVVVRGEHSTFHFPIVTCLLLSLALTAILSLVRWLR